MRAVLPLVSLGLVLALSAAAAAQPADKPDFAHAAELYKQAEVEMNAGQYADAARDYAVAYDITKDPVLFFKIASADDKSGRCDLALTYYRRYLKEGSPNDEYERLTRERIGVCEKATGQVSEPDPGTGTGTGTETGTGTGTETGTGTGTETGTGTGTGGGTTDDATAQLSGERPSLSAEHPSKKRGAAWIVLGVGIALGTVGAVAAMSAEAAEKDLQDLSDIRIQGRPPEFTPATQQRYDDLVDQGKRYQTLSWVAFGIAGAALAGAAVLFVASAGDGEHAPPPVGLSVTGSGATVSAGWSF